MAIVDLDALSAEFPDNRIVLINGSELVCSPKVVKPEIYSEDNLSLDKSGEHLTVGAMPVVKKPETDNVELKDIFIRMLSSSSVMLIAY